MQERRVLAASVLAVCAAVTACGSVTTSTSTSSTTGTAATTASTGTSPSPCAGGACPGRPPLGATQALHVITVQISGDVATTSGEQDLGMTDQVRVGVGQRVVLDVDARIPPQPAETGGAHLLSDITTDPSVPADAAAPAAGRYRLHFTAARAGSTSLAYLPATCALPPGAC